MYYDPVENIFYYPKRVLEEIEWYERQRIFRKPFLYIDRKTKNYYEPASGEDYMPLNGKEELEQLQLKIETKASYGKGSSNIYYDLDAKVFYYPESAFDETERIPRQILFDKERPIIFNPRTDFYVHEFSGEKYFVSTGRFLEAAATLWGG